MLAVLLAAVALASPGLPGSWTPVSRGPDGGVVWQGRIPNRAVPSDIRLSAVYLPPAYSPVRRYPVIYLLHGMRGSPSGFYNSLKIASVADTLIMDGRMPPFIAVMPVAGPLFNRGGGEWVGPWEDFLVRDVVPWTDSHLSTIARTSGRALAGLSAGGYGAVDIGLRHPGMFGTLESWAGYFAPVFGDAGFSRFTPAQAAAHTPTLLLPREAAVLRRDHVRFFLSTAGDHSGVRARWTTSFSRLVRSFGLAHELWIAPHGKWHHFWTATFQPALLYAGAGWTAPRSGGVAAGPPAP